MSYTQFEVLNNLTEDEILDKISKYLRKSLNTSVSYGYDALADRYFLTAPDYRGAYVDFMGRFLRERRWDVLQRVIELLEQSVTDNLKKAYEGILEIEYLD